MKTTLDTFKIIGISVRTTNENGQATKDIPFLWNKFFEENIQAKINGKLSDDLYCVYTDYEKDHTKPYTTIIGFKVDNSQVVPEGLVAKTINANTYQIFTAKGNPTKGSVYAEWQNIWNSDINRSFTSDFEIYGSKSKTGDDAEVDIFISLK